MITKDLKMSILHFNHTLQELEIVSTYTIDKQILGGSNGKQLKEVAYLTYDTGLQTVLIVFRENYVLTVNIEQKATGSNQGGKSCGCHSHPEITNFTLTEIESQSAIAFKRVQMKSSNGKQSSYLVILNEELTDSYRDQLLRQDATNSTYNMKFHELTLKDEGNNQVSTTLFDNVWTVLLEDILLNNDVDTVFYSFTYSKKHCQFILFNERGVSIFTVNAVDTNASSA